MITHKNYKRYKRELIRWGIILIVYLNIGTSWLIAASKSQLSVWHNGVKIQIENSSVNEKEASRIHVNTVGNEKGYYTVFLFNQVEKSVPLNYEGVAFELYNTSNEAITLNISMEEKNGSIIHTTEESPVILEDEWQKKKVVYVKNGGITIPKDFCGKVYVPIKFGQISSYGVTVTLPEETSWSFMLMPMKLVPKGQGISPREAFSITIKGDTQLTRPRIGEFIEAYTKEIKDLSGKIINHKVKWALVEETIDVDINEEGLLTIGPLAKAQTIEIMASIENHPEWSQVITVDISEQSNETDQENEISMPLAEEITNLKETMNWRVDERIVSIIRITSLLGLVGCVMYLNKYLK